MLLPLLPTPLPPAQDLYELFRRYTRCYQCPLAYSRRRIMPGKGNRERALVLLTDRVAGIDEHEGALLSGPAGEIQAKILAAPRVEIPAETVYLTSTVLCRAPRDRMPRAHEAMACGERLWRELALVRPIVIVALGTRAADALLGDIRPEREPHRWLHWSDGDRDVPLYVTLHPREAIWGEERETRRRKRILYDDWQAISARYRELCSLAGEDPAGGRPR